MARHDARRLAASISLAMLCACSPAPSAPPTGGAPKPPRPATSPAPSAGPVTPQGSLAPASTAPATSPSPIVAPLTPVSPAPSGAPLATTALAGKLLAPPAIVTAAGGLISDKGVGIIANNGGGLVSNNGSNIIANNGGGLIGNNGGGLVSKTKYALAQAAEQVPLQGVPVRLYDAAGNPVVGEDGQPVVAVTDEAGRYAFAGVRPDLHLVVKGELPKVGALSRIAAPGVADAPLDLASTLATTYILDKFVATQEDKRATLARLPADVEAETVLIAGQAAAKEAPPVTLASAELVAKVDALRATSTTLDAQLEKVKKLLIVAGASNLGDGQLATEVVLEYLRAVLPRPDGTIYLHSADLWRLGTDGRLRAVTGAAATGPGAAVGLRGALMEDDAGRLVAGGGTKGVVRLTPGATPADLKVEVLAPELTGVDLICPLAGEVVLAFRDGAEGREAWRVAAGQAAEKVPDPMGAIKATSLSGRAARLPDGKVRLETSNLVGPSFRDLDPATGAATVVDLPAGGLRHRLAADGTIYFLAGDVVKALPPGGAAAVVPDLPADAYGRASAIVVAPGGGYYVARNVPAPSGVTFKDLAQLHLVKGATSTHLAGLASGAASPAPSAGPGGPVTLQKPTAFDVEADGDLLVVDNAVLYRVTPGGAATSLMPEVLTDPSDGATFRAHEAFPLADGGCMLAAIHNNPPVGKARHAFFRIGPDGATTLVERLPAMFGNAGAHAPDAGGGLIGVANEGVRRITPAGDRPLLTAVGGRLWYDGARPVVAKDVGAFLSPKYLPTRFEPDGTTTTLSELAPEDVPMLVDAQGRVYKGGATVTRKDPTTGETVVLAGAGGRTFAGDTIDTSIGNVVQAVFAPGGDLYVLDTSHKQIKRIPADKL